MNKKLLTILQYMFFAALAIFFVWLSLRGLDKEKWGELKKALERAHYWLLLPIFLLLLLSHWFRALRWRQLMEPMGYYPSQLNAFFCVMIGYFVNQGAPRLGEVAKCTILAKYEKVPADKLVGTIVAERAFDVLCLITVFGLTFILQFPVISKLVNDDVLPLFLDKNGTVSYTKIVIIVASLIVLLVLLKYLFGRLGHINIVQKIKTILLNIWHGLTSVKDLKNKPLFVLYTVCIWVLYWLSTWMGFFAIAETSHLGLTDAITVLAMGSIGMIASPGGIGAYALLVQKTVALYDIPAVPYGQ
ncbi:MAG TPA: lysylphosphatidylglycerol synthase transmembrane domain-containing protein, partial [Chitinophagaceae bacterium]